MATTRSRYLYVYSYVDGVQVSWGKWELAAGTEILSTNISDGLLSIVSKHSDGIYFSTIDLSSLGETRQAHLDRYKRFTAGTYSSTTNKTTWTLPYSLATNGTEGTVVVRRADTNVDLTATRPSATTVSADGNLSAVAVDIGIAYTAEFTLSTIFKRDQRSQGQPADTSGRLTLNNITLHHDHTDGFSVKVTPKGRSAYTYQPRVGSIGGSGDFRVPVHARNEDATIEVTDTSGGAFRFSGFDWEGRYNLRSRSI